MIRQTFKTIFHRTGALRMYSRRHPHRITVLLYHGFRRADGDPEREEGDEKFTPIDLFERQLDICCYYGTVVPLTEILSAVQLPPNPVVLTFDDGYRNNWELAFPLLRKFGVPATVFLTTGFLDGHTPLWTDKIDLFITNGPAGVWDTQLGGESFRLDLTDSAARSGTRDAVKKRMKRLSPVDIQRFLEFHQRIWNVPDCGYHIPEPLRPLQWEQVREMGKSGLVEFGAHTVSHSVLSMCSPESQEWEIQNSKQRIEEELGQPCITFAYPNGRSEDFTGETVKILRSCGIRAALTTERGFIYPPLKDNFRLPRWGAPSTEVDLAYLLSK